MESSVIRHLQTHGTDCDFVAVGLPGPTYAKPGTPEKIDVFRKRLEAGEQLHHPQDAQAVATSELKAYWTTNLSDAL